MVCTALALRAIGGRTVVALIVMVVEVGRNPRNMDMPFGLLGELQYGDLPEVGFGNVVVEDCLDGGQVVIDDQVQCVNNGLAIRLDPCVYSAGLKYVNDSSKLRSVCALGWTIEHGTVIVRDVTAKVHSPPGTRQDMGCGMDG